MHPLDFGTWFYYMLYVCLFHIPLHVALSAAGIPLYFLGRKELLSAGTVLAVTSGLCFGLSMVLPARGDALASGLAWLLLALALGIAAAIRASSPPALRGFLYHCEEPDMIAVVSIGAILALIATPYLPFARQLRLDDDAIAMVWVVGVSLYWCPALLIPRRLMVGASQPPLAIML